MSSDTYWANVHYNSINYAKINDVPCACVYRLTYIHVAILMANVIWYHAVKAPSLWWWIIVRGDSIQAHFACSPANGKERSTSKSSICLETLYFRFVRKVPASLSTVMAAVSPRSVAEQATLVIIITYVIIIHISIICYGWSSDRKIDTCMIMQKSKLV